MSSAPPACAPTRRAQWIATRALHGKRTLHRAVEPEKRQRLRALFDGLDLDGGGVSAPRGGGRRRRPGDVFEDCSQESLSPPLRAGSISPGELVAAVRGLELGVTDSMILEHFGKMDADKSGT